MSINVTVVGSTGVSTSITNSEVVSVGVGTFVAQAVTGLLVQAGQNVTVTTSDGVFTIASANPPVTSVNGRTGAVSVTRSELGAAPASHTHQVVNITDFSAGVLANAPVSTVNGRTGTVTLVASDVSAASASHSHVAANISNLTSVANVVSVNGRTGVVALVASDVSAASASHSHVAANITDLTSVANVVSVNGRTGQVQLIGSGVTITTSTPSVVTITAPTFLASSISSVNGRTGAVTLVAADVSAASASHSHVAANITDLTSVANVVSVNGRTGQVQLIGAGVTITTSTPSIVTISASTAASASVELQSSGTHIQWRNVGETAWNNVVALSEITGPSGSFSDAQTISAKTASHTLVIGDAGKLLTFDDSSGTLTITVPTNDDVAFPVGTHIDIARIGDAAVEVAGDDGVTVNATPSLSLRAKYSAGTLIKTGTNAWLLIGDLA